MCIALVTTAHAEYPFILLDNRDEFLSRPTARADWWTASQELILGGRDLQRPEHGTWLGVTRQGRFAVLTNFREEGVEVNKAKSRGGIPIAWLATTDTASNKSPEQFVESLLKATGIHDVGGFSLWFGYLPERVSSSSDNVPQGVTIVSNRTSSADGLTRIATKAGETHGLSNSHFGDRTWPKVVNGEVLLSRAIEASEQEKEGEHDLVERLFGVLSVDTLPAPQAGEDWQTFSRHLRESIFIPLVGGEAMNNNASSTDEKRAVTSAQIKIGSGVYGTQQQTVLLVHKSGRVKFVQRTLYDERGAPLPKEVRDASFDFELPGTANV